METLRRLLLATDLNARSDRAMDRASLLAKQYGAELVVLHVLEARGEGARSVRRERFSAPFHPNAESMARARRQLLGDFRDMAERTTILIEEGDAHEVILQTARAQGCDLVVTGVARNEMFGQLTLGKTVDRLVRAAQFPLLIVADRARGPYRNVVVAADFSEASRQALQVAAKLFASQSITVLHAHAAPVAYAAADREHHVAQFRQLAHQQYIEFLESSGLPDSVRARLRPAIEWGDPAVLLRELVVKIDADLAVFGTHGRGALLRAFVGSVAQRIAEFLPCDALVIPLTRGTADASQIEQRASKPNRRRPPRQER